MWLLFALLTPFFFGIVHILDEHCVGEVFDKPWFGIVTGAVTSAAVFLLLPYLAPLLNWHMPSGTIIVLSLLAGALIQGSVALYFYALSYTEAGIVAAYWNLVPALVPLLSFVILGSILSTGQYVGIVILIAVSVIFCLIDTNYEHRWISFFLMLLASLLQASVFLLQDVIYDAIPFSEGFYLITTGLILAGFVPLMRRKNREEIRRHSPTLIRIGKLLFFIEAANLLALAASQKAVSLGDPSLVAAVESTIPGYTFLLSLGLFFYSSKYGNIHAKQFLGTKMALVGVMILGVYLVA